MRSDEIDPRPATTEELLRLLDRVPSRDACGESTVRQSRAAEDGGKLCRNCPPPSAYMEVALGICDRAEGQALVDHAAVCSLCAQALAASLRALEGNPSAEETKALAALVTTQPKYQRDLSHKLAESSAGRRPLLSASGSRHLLWMGAAAAVIVALAASLLAWQRHIGAPERLLARAYQDTRTLELRIPGAGFAALTPGAHTRGGSGTTESAALLEARAKLARELQAAPEDTRSLGLAARADLLEEHYDAAIDKIDRLIAKGPATAELLTDGATAYFERGLVSGRELDRTVALDYLRRADLLAPDDAVVLFNEAIVMEDRGQLINAVEVWHRFATVERDPGWAAEGKRRLAALETVLDRLRSHESRLSRMLAAPATMEALAGDAQRLGQWDEELSSVELDKLVEKAFPGPAESEEESARGSPCLAICQAARRLLFATGRSLAQQHHDEWLADLLPSSLLLSSPFEALPLTIQTRYAQAMRLVAEAARQNQTGRPEMGASEASQARQLFLEIARESGAGEPWRKAGEAGAWRSAAEYLFALQRETDFAGCRAFAEGLTSRGAGRQGVPHSYPWITALFAITEKICDDTPQTRDAGQMLGLEALRVASDAHYGLLTARIQLHIGNTSELAGNQEQREEEVLGTLRELMRGDPPPIRIVNTLTSLSYIEYPSPRAYATASLEQEAVGWAQLAGDDRDVISLRMRLGLVKVKLGSIQEAQAEFEAARKLAARLWPGESYSPANNGEILTEIAEALLEQRDVGGARRALELAHSLKRSLSDAWLLSKNAAVTGQIALEQHDYSGAERVLEAQIRQREGAREDGGGATNYGAEQGWGFAARDHDLYGELAAAWLADGRPALDVLALWERFRLRSQGLAVHACADGGLGCEREELEAERQRLGRSLLTGEIVLMDRVLVYEMDQRGVRWSTRKAQRQEALNAVNTLQWAASSPLTSPATVELMGKPLAALLLPAWTNDRSKDLPMEARTLLLEPDPELRGLAWPVMPTARGPLGLNFAMVEIPSILVHSAGAETETQRISLDGGGHGRPLVIGASISGRDETPLPEVIDEARHVAEHLEAPDLLLGSRATAQNVAAALAGASVVHFAGHAVQDDGGTRLLLAHGSGVEGRADAHGEARPESRTWIDSRPWIDESFLRAHPPRACRLAVLSACATGGDERAVTGPLHDLVTTLSSLGVPQVVATRWPVDSEASVSFMKAFYGSLDAGRSVAQALLAARQAQARTGAYGNPYFWGAYYLTGREQRSVEEDLHASTISKSSQDRPWEREF